MAAGTIDPAASTLGGGGRPDGEHTSRVRSWVRRPQPPLILPASFRSKSSRLVVLLGLTLARGAARGDDGERSPCEGVAAPLRPSV